MFEVEDPGDPDLTLSEVCQIVFPACPDCGGSCMRSNKEGVISNGDGTDL